MLWFCFSINNLFLKNKLYTCQHAHKQLHRARQKFKLLPAYKSRPEEYVPVSHHVSTDRKKNLLSFYTGFQINSCNKIDQFLRMGPFPKKLNYEPQFDVIHFSILLQFHTTLPTAEVLNKKWTGEKETSPPFLSFSFLILALGTFSPNQTKENHLYYLLLHKML